MDILRIKIGSMEYVQFILKTKNTSGTYDAINLTGNQYIELLLRDDINHSNGFATAVGSNTITLSKDAIDRDDHYNGYFVNIINVEGVMLSEKITDYVGSSRLATVENAWSPSILAGYEYVIYKRFRTSDSSPLLYVTDVNNGIVELRPIELTFQLKTEWSGAFIIKDSVGVLHPVPENGLVDEGVFKINVLMKT